MEGTRCKSKETDSEKAEIKLEPDRVNLPDGVKGTTMAAMPRGPDGGRGSYEAVTFELVSQHFSMPITQAAKELKVGLTFLKTRCRELGIPRWPHRKVKSLQKLISDVQELGKETEQGDGHLTRMVVEKLQQTKKLIEERPEVMLDEETKVLRQACFKESYKRRRRLMGQGHGTSD
ncbi:hypothetical protein ACP70R_026225 [Stipagrostis hirtigluma subsp. patula]